MSARRASRLIVIACAPLSVAGFLIGAVPTQGAERLLCIEGHPAPRPHGVTYGGLRARHGYERDHCMPLGLGGPDTPANVWYQPWPEALRKDEIEDREIEAYCRGDVTLADARAHFPADRCIPGAW
jgi:hypothetical protein